MWTETTRRQHARKGLRCASDLTDAEWSVIEPLPPRRAEKTLDPSPSRVWWPRVGSGQGEATREWLRESETAPFPTPGEEAQA